MRAAVLRAMPILNSSDLHSSPVRQVLLVPFDRRGHRSTRAEVTCPTVQAGKGQSWGLKGTCVYTGL